MYLTIGNLHTRLSQSTDEERNWLSDYLTFESVVFRGNRPSKHVERMFNVFDNTFPAGFTAMVAKAAKDPEGTGQPLGFPVHLLDARQAPCVPDQGADLLWLRAYQLDAVNAVVAKTRGILWLPTGAGKTEVAVGLTRALPCRWLFLVHRTNLADQAAERYEARTGLSAGRIAEGTWSVPDDAMFVCATFQTINAALEKGDVRTEELLANWAQGVIVDECHTLPAGSFWGVAMRTRDAYYRVGLSGTPLARGDKRSLLAIAALGSVVHRVRTDLLIARGVLAKPRVRMATVPQLAKAKTWAGVYSECIVNSKPRNRALVELARRSAKPAFLFVKEVKHGKQLVDQLMRAGIKAEFVWGDHSIEWRKSHVRRLVKGRFDVLVCSVIFQEGIDVPELRSTIIAAGGESVIAALQRLGRGMRVERDKDGNVVPGGDEFEVWDIADKGNKWLEKHARARRSAYEAEGHVTIVEPVQPSTLRQVPGAV